MNTKHLFLAAALLVGASAFTSCSKDDDTTPVVSISDLNEVIEIKQGGILTLSPSFNNVDDKTTYTWSENGKTLSTAKIFEYKATEAGEHKITLKVVTANYGECKKEFTIKVIEELSTVDFEGDYWTHFIDSEQNNGNLLYGKNAAGVVDYSWKDMTNYLSSQLAAAWGGSWGFAEGGVAISNYVDADITNNCNPDHQLSVPSLKESNGKNFAVVYCASMVHGSCAAISFSDGRAREIKTIDIAPTTYQLGVTKNGNGSAKALTQKGDYLKIIISGYDKDDKLVDTQSIDMARDGKITDNWQTITLNGTVNGQSFSFGKCVKYEFSMEGSDNNDYGLLTPAYFAFDNVVINMYAE